MNSSHTTFPACEGLVGLSAGLYTGLPQHSQVAIAALIFIIIINILSFLLNTVLNALVMIAVKTKSRLRTQKSNILLALLASTDIMVGIAIQPGFIAVLVMPLFDEKCGCHVFRAFRFATGTVIKSSLFHLVLISGERYIAIKHPFAYTTIVTEARLLVASAVVWLLSVILQIPTVVDKALFFPINNTFVGLSIAFIVVCHVTVYRETRRHERQVAALQDTQQAREQFQKDKKALKLTRIILGVLCLCYIPMVVNANVALWSRETEYMFFSASATTVFLNSLINPIIFLVRIRQLRVALIELTCRTVTIAAAEEIEMQVFGTPNSVVRLEAGREHGGLDQQSLKQANVND